MTEGEKRENWDLDRAIQDYLSEYAWFEGFAQFLTSADDLLPILGERFNERSGKPIKTFTEYSKKYVLTESTDRYHAEIQRFDEVAEEINILFADFFNHNKMSADDFIAALKPKFAEVISMMRGIVDEINKKTTTDQIDTEDSEE